MMKLWRRRENIKIVEEGIKTLRRKNNKILSWRRRKILMKREMGKQNILSNVKKYGFPSLTISIESLI